MVYFVFENVNLVLGILVFGILDLVFGILDGCAKVRANYWLQPLPLFADKLTN